MRAALLLALLAACDDDASPSVDDTDAADDTDAPATDTDYAEPAALLSLTTPVPGDTTCFDPAGTWGAQTADASCVATVPVTGDIEDFESGDGVADATIELFWNDALDDAPDSTLTSDASGLVGGGEAPTCAAFTARIFTDALHEETKLTIQQHWTEGPGNPMDTFFNSVATSTYLLIPAILSGARPDPTKGIVAGTAYDCGGEGVPVANVQVLVRDDTGYLTTPKVHYFIEEFPSPTATETSADGLWMILNVPPGRLTIEMWGLVGDATEPQLLGATGADIVPDGITITDLYLGDDDGVKLDESCLAPCAM